MLLHITTHTKSESEEQNACKQDKERDVKQRQYK